MNGETLRSVNLVWSCFQCVLRPDDASYCILTEILRCSRIVRTGVDVDEQYCAYAFRTKHTLAAKLERNQVFTVQDVRKAQISRAHLYREFAHVERTRVILHDDGR